MSNNTIVYLVTDVTSANIFGYAQILALSEQGYKVHLICNSNKLTLLINWYIVIYFR